MIEKIKEKLFELADEKYKKFHSNLCPGTNNIIGVRVPILRNYAKELMKSHNTKELLKQIDNEYYEEIMLQGMLIGLSNESFDKIKVYIENFIPKIDNWAVCDIFCAGLKTTKNNKKEMWKLIQKYIRSNKEFEIRFGIVMILDYYIDKEYLKYDFKIFDSITSKEYYAQMAVAWAISICLIKFYDETIEYLVNSNIDKFTYNKSLQKAIESYRINDKQKKFLQDLKK